MKNIVFLLFVFLVTFSCKEEEEGKIINPNEIKGFNVLHNQVKSKWDEVMKIHDEVMPKMGEIGSLIAQLRKKIDSDMGGATEKNVMEDLQDANTAMMVWMQDFGGNYELDEIMNIKEVNLEELEGVTLVAEELKSDWFKKEAEKIKLQLVEDEKNKLEWLSKEEKKVKIVAEKINSSIAEAKVLLGK